MKRFSMLLSVVALVLFAINCRTDAQTAVKKVANKDMYKSLPGGGVPGYWLPGGGVPGISGGGVPGNPIAGGGVPGTSAFRVPNVAGGGVLGIRMPVYQNKSGLPGSMLKNSHK